MQALIHKASLHGLKIRIRGSGIVPGQPVELECHAERELAVVVTSPSRWSFGLGKPKRRILGYLHPEASAMIMPAIEKAASLRVRIVEIEPAHARMEGVDQISVSVWGEPADLKPLLFPQA